MALVQCPECRGAVSTAAQSCPHCGYCVGGAQAGQWAPASHHAVQQPHRYPQGVYGVAPQQSAPAYAPIPGAQPPVGATQPRQAAANKTRNTIIGIAAISSVFVIFVIAVGWASQGEISGSESAGQSKTPAAAKPAATPTKTGYKEDHISAWVMAQEFVKRKLKSPGSADFGSLLGDYQKPSSCVTYLGDREYRVKGWVDAQNAFGAKLRNHFVLKLKHVGGADDEWRCIDGPTFAE